MIEFHDSVNSVDYMIDLRDISNIERRFRSSRRSESNYDVIFTFKSGKVIEMTLSDVDVTRLSSAVENT
ncbi:hypothetical protein MMO38_05275 [Acinetobacter sp. NIPH 1852]|uniref:hypothetical protein n=1 Tax=Acinetobacter sp. NIPH 1852 TaxID=2923428 RepID=UPI001F4B810A|nr:hypothetical protein [Acinetobacter sp. NIPH 1852]MCH7307557.1 hypothetical protein [Acinetobacter sp. NIPH 1852]